jgi:hypothetical protein
LRLSGARKGVRCSRGLGGRILVRRPPSCEASQEGMDNTCPRGDVAADPSEQPKSRALGETYIVQRRNNQRGQKPTPSKMAGYNCQIHASERQDDRNEEGETETGNG